jgi:hypothetical protein
VDIKNSQSGDKDEQTKAQVEDRLQATGERDVDLGVDIDQVSAPAATAGLMRLETVGDFLEGCVSEMEPRKLVDTYDDNVSDNVSEREGRKSASETTKGGGTNIDCSNELDDNSVSARVVIAATKLGNNSVALVAEVGEGVLDVGRGPLRDDFGDSAGEGHSTGGEDSKDGGETHDEEA